MAKLDRFILFAIGTIALVIFSSFSALLLNGLLWIVPSWKENALANLILYVICFAVILPGILISGACYSMAFSSKTKDPTPP